MEKKRILIVDDEIELVKAIEIILKQAGYEVLTAYNGQVALEKAHKAKPDLVLLDIMMPGIDGIEVLRRLREGTDTTYIPVIMLTCKGDSESIIGAHDLEIVDYIIKPFDSKKLLNLIKKYI